MGEREREIWKRKKSPYPQGVCAARGCEALSEGWTPTKRRGKTWYAPVCAKCMAEQQNGNTDVRPVTIEVVANHQGYDVERVAAVLDIPVGAVIGMFRSAGLTDEGRSAAQPSEAQSTPTQSPGEAAQLVPPDDLAFQKATVVAQIPKAKLTAHKKEADSLLERLRGNGADNSGFVIVDQRGMDLARDIGQNVKRQYNEIEGWRKEAVKPLNEAKAKVQEAFKPVLGSLSAIEEELKKRIYESQKRMEAQQDAALQQVQQSYAQGDAQGAALATQHAQASDVSIPDGVSVRMLVDFVVVNIEEVPREFFVLDTKAVQDALRQGRNIPGIRRVDRPSVALRS